MLQRLAIQNLRCLREVELDLHPEVNMLVGANATGKTSILEAIHLLSFGRSFRTRHPAELIRRGATVCVCTARIRSAEGRVGHRVGIELRAEGRRVRLDGQPIRSSRELARVLRAQLIDPQSHRLITAGPEYRRGLLDWAVFHVEQGFAGVWVDYRRALRQRNALLRAGGTDAALEPWERVMARTGERLAGLRCALLPDLERLVREEVGQLLPECDVRLVFRRGWASGSSLLEALRGARAGDRKVGHSRVGPHRADVIVDTGLGPASRMLSQGQQKLLVLALLMAQFRLVSERVGEGGVLLVDDLAAELDHERWTKAMVRLRGMGVQLVMTALGKGPAMGALDGGGRWFHVEQGRLRRI